MRWKECAMAFIKPVQIMKRGKKYQLYYYNPRRERRRISVGDVYQHAQRLAVKFNDWLMEGKDPEVEILKAQENSSIQSLTLKDIFSLFMEKHGIFRSKTMQTSYQVSFASISRCPALINAPLGSFTKRLVWDYMQERMKIDKVKAATVNKDAAFLKCLFSKLYEWEMLDRNVLQGMKLFKEGGKRDVFLTVQQALSLIQELPEPIANIVEFAMYTGFRKENILDLQIKDIRLHDLTPTGEVELVIKGGRQELFPLGPAALDVVKRAIGMRKSGFVFVNPETGTRYVQINKTFDRAVRRLGLCISDGSKLRIHDLRHVFATWLHREGVSLDLLRSLLGHKDRATTDRYTSVDRLETGKVLGIIPNLREIEKRNSLDKVAVEG
jgi:integrase